MFRGWEMTEEPNNKVTDTSGLTDSRNTVEIFKIILGSGGYTTEEYHIVLQSPDQSQKELQEQAVNLLEKLK